MVGVRMDGQASCVGLQLRGVYSREWVSDVGVESNPFYNQHHSFILFIYSPIFTLSRCVNHYQFSFTLSPVSLFNR